MLLINNGNDYVKMQGVRYSKGLLALHLRLIEDHWEAAQSNQEEDQNCPAMETHKNS